MANYDRKFEIIRPSLDRLVIAPLEVSDVGLLDPTSTSPVPLVDGEFVQLNTSYKYARATDAAIPAFASIEDRGDYGVQASRKLSAIMIGGYEADTLIFDTALVTLGVAVKVGTVNNATVGSVNRAGLIAQGGTGLVTGYITRVASANGGRLRFLQTLV